MVKKEKNSANNIRTAFFINFAFTIIEIVGGILTNSISIMSDAIHDLGDSLSLGISWVLEKKAAKKPDEQYTYGYARYSLLGGLVNSLVLVIGSTIIVVRAIPRIIHPESVNEQGMIILALFGIAVNGIAAYRTSKGSGINEKVVSLHLLEDVLGWVAVLITSIVMLFTDIKVLDPILSILITLFILYNVLKNIKKISAIFMEKAPSNIRVDSIKETIINKTDVMDIHHIHLWSLEGVNNYITFHAVVNKESTNGDTCKIKTQIHKELLLLSINHATIEIEYEGDSCNNYNCEYEKVSNDSHHHHH